MTIEEYNQRLRGVINDIEGGVHAQIMAELALDALALIKLRITKTGINADGIAYADIMTNMTSTSTPHSDYTPRYKRFKSGLVKHRKGTKNKNTSNKYKGFIDFSFSTRMWSNMSLSSSAAEHQTGIAKVKCSTTFEQDKLNWNTGMRGPILAISDKERDMLLEVYDKKILKIWRNNGL